MSVMRRDPLRYVLAILLGSGLILFCFSLVYSLFYRAQISLAPDHTFYCTLTKEATVVVLLGSAVLSISIGLLAASLAAQTLSLMPGFGAWPSLSAGGLTRFAGITVLIVVPISLVALHSTVCLSESTIFYRAHLLSRTRTFPIAEITEVRPRCREGSRGGWVVGLDILVGNARFDLAYDNFHYPAASEKVLRVLQGIPSSTVQIAHGCPAELQRLIVAE